MKSWKMVIGIISLSLMVFTAGCGDQKQQQSGQSAEKIVIRAAHTTNTEYPYHIGMVAFAKAMDEKTNGKVEVKIFPNGSLGGDERQVIEMLQMGTLEMTVVNSAPMSAFSPKIDVFNLPFMFRDLPHLYAALDGEPGKIVAKEIEGKGLKVLGWWMNPGRSIFNTKKPINTLEDLKGMKIRTTQSQVSVATFNALGALATPMAYGEVYSALQQGVVEGSDDVAAGYLGMKFYEVAPYYSLTKHFYVACPLLMDPNFYNKMTPEIQKAIDESAAIATQAMRKYTEAQMEKDMKALAEKGAKINNVENLEPWKKAVEPVYKQFEDKIGKDLIELTRSAK